MSVPFASERTERVNEFAMGLRPTHGDESTQYQGSLIPNRLGRDFRGSVLASRVENRRSNCSLPVDI
jgi:hypothetical protein